MEFDPDKASEMIRLSRERIVSTRVLSRDLKESIRATEKAIESSIHVLQVNGTIVKGLYYYSHTCGGHSYRDKLGFFRS